MLRLVPASPRRRLRAPEGGESRRPRPPQRVRVAAVFRLVAVGDHVLHAVARLEDALAWVERHDPPFLFRRRTSGRRRLGGGGHAEVPVATVVQRHAAIGRDRATDHRLRQPEGAQVVVLGAELEARPLAPPRLLLVVAVVFAVQAPLGARPHAHVPDALVGQFHGPGARVAAPLQLQAPRVHLLALGRLAPLRHVLGAARDLGLLLRAVARLGLDHVVRGRVADVGGGAQQPTRVVLAEMRRWSTHVLTSSPTSNCSSSRASAHFSGSRTLCAEKRWRIRSLEKGIGLRAGSSASSLVDSTHWLYVKR
eukprot:456041-Prymnesium_polylepis.1